MIKKKHLFALVLILLFSGNVISQDLNQTNYRYAPLYLNPAQTGGFYGSVRVGGNYREQGQTLLFEGYETYQLFADMPINFGFRKQDWIGVGVQAFGDKAGVLDLGSTGALINVAYHYALNKDRTSDLSFGVQYGVVQKKIDASRAVMEISNGKDLTSLQTFDESYSDLSMGLSYNTRLKNGSYFQAGVSLFHFLKPSFQGLIQNDIVVPRLTVHSKYGRQINKRIIIQPEIIASFAGKATNIMPQFKTFYKLKADTKRKKYNDKVYMGLGYRVQDALLLMVGMEYKGFDVGVAYDVTLSTASEFNSNQGGFEIGVFKIINIVKKPKVKPVIFCPRL